MNDKPLQRVLIMEDNVLLAHEWQQCFELNQFDVTLCHEGKDAVTLIETHDYDIVVTDLFVNNGAGGLHVLLAAKVRKKTPLPVIVVTGSISPSSHRSEENFYLKQASGLGAKVVLEKPFPALELVSKAQSILQNDV